MRLVLTFMAMAVLVVSIGCDKEAADTSSPKPDAGGAAAPEKADAGTPDADDSSATANTSGTQTVSLKLPGMT